MLSPKKLTAANPPRDLDAPTTQLDQLDALAIAARAYAVTWLQGTVGRYDPSTLDQSWGRFLARLVLAGECGAEAAVSRAAASQSGTPETQVASVWQAVAEAICPPLMSAAGEPYGQASLYGE